MKHVFSVIAAVLFWSVFIIPADSAPWQTYFLWAVYAVSTLWAVNLIWKRLEDDEREKVEK